MCEYFYRVVTDVTEHLNGSPYDALKLRAKNKAKIKTAILSISKYIILTFAHSGIVFARPRRWG